MQRTCTHLCCPQVQLALRRERDALASEVDSLRQDLANVGRERDELATKVGGALGV